MSGMMRSRVSGRFCSCCAQADRAVEQRQWRRAEVLHERQLDEHDRDLGQIVDCVDCDAEWDALSYGWWLELKDRADEYDIEWRH